MHAIAFQMPQKWKSGQGNSMIGIFVSIGTETHISGESCPVNNSQPIVWLSLTFASLAERIGVLAWGEGLFTQRGTLWLYFPAYLTQH